MMFLWSYLSLRCDATASRGCAGGGSSSPGGRGLDGGHGSFDNATEAFLGALGELEDTTNVGASFRTGIIDCPARQFLEQDEPQLALGQPFAHDALQQGWRG